MLNIKKSTNSSDFYYYVERFQIISFDFFDTLFFRLVESPDDIFRILGKKFSISNFLELRQEAQSKAFQLMIKNKRQEITLTEIYQCLKLLFELHKIDQDVSFLQKEEYNLELSILKPNEDLRYIFESLSNSDKTLVITSDMYLPQTFFEEALKLHQLPNVKLFISSEKNATKRDYGNLYTHLIQDLNVEPSSILHIGDNYDSDILCAELKQISTYYYQSSQKILKDKFLNEIYNDSCAYLSSSISNSLFYFQEVDFCKDPYKRMGFLYGGPTIYGFLKWLREQIKVDKIEYVIFIARDGYILNSLVDQFQLFKDLKINLKYFMSSRVSLTLASITEKNFAEFIPFLLSGSYGLSPHEVLERIGVETPSRRVMDDLGLNDSIVINEQNIVQMQAFLMAYRNPILKVCAENRYALFNYIKESGIVLGSKVAMVDVGWSGTTQKALEYFNQNFLYPMLDITGYYFCLADTDQRRQLSSTQKMKSMLNSNNIKPYSMELIYRNRVIIELFFSAPHDTVIGLKLISNKIFPVTDPGRLLSENDSFKRLLRFSIISKLHDGILTYFKSLLESLDHLDFINSEIPENFLIPLISLACHDSAYTKFISIQGFDTWGSSKNHSFGVQDC